MIGVDASVIKLTKIGNSKVEGKTEARHLADQDLLLEFEVTNAAQTTGSQL